MATYLSGYGATLAIGTFTPGWDHTAGAATGKINRIRQSQNKDQTQVEVMGQAFANTVVGAYHTQYTLDIAVPDDLATNDLEVGNSGELIFTYATGPDKFTVTVVITQVSVDATVDGAVVGTITIAGNSALVHAVTGP